MRIALQRLEVEGMIQRTAGRGTFVAHQSPNDFTSHTIGYITHSFHNEIHSVMLGSAQTELRSAGYQVIFSNATTLAEEAAILQQLLDENIAGLMIWASARPTADTVAVLKEFQRRRTPIVFIDRVIDDIKADYVASDNFGGAYELVSHLISLGHQHIVQLMPNISGLRAIDDRHRGYAAAAQDHGLSVYAPWKLDPPKRPEFHETDIHSLVGDESAQIIEQVVRLLNAVETKPTAIACINDILAIITISALREIGIAVPDEMSVVGFDDISMASHIGVPLSTVAQDAYMLGKSASKRLLDRLDGDNSPPRTCTVPTRLRIRASTAAPLVDAGRMVST